MDINMKTVTFHTAETIDNFITQNPPAPHVWEWVKNIPDGDIHIFEDSLLPEHIKYPNAIKIAMLMEAPAIYDHCKNNNPSQFHPYQWITQNHQHFKYVMSTFNSVKNIVGEEKYLWFPSGGARIKPEDFGMYEKDRLLSIVASHKKWTVGHRLRHEIINRFPRKMEIYGSGYNDIINEHGKIIALAPYAFSFAVMNSKENDYFTEILTDVLSTGTIPIFWGTDNIGKYFNTDGIITFNKLEELDEIMPTLTMELYQSKLTAITENIELAKKYNTRFDWLYENYKTKFETL
jgi:hypothetical protein